MHDEKRFTASTPTVLDSTDGTPLDRQILSPLTPLAIDEWHTASDPQSPVSAVLDLMKQRHRGISTGQSGQFKVTPLEFKVTPLEYKVLLTRLEELPELKGFALQKLRYVTIRIALWAENAT